MLDAHTASRYLGLLLELKMGNWVSNATKDIWVSWSWWAGPWTESTPCLTDRVGDRDLVRQFLLPREPRVKASVTAGTRPGARKKITDNNSPGG